jgi:hypothetical protein
MITDIFVLDLLLGLAGFVLTLWALITGAVWLIAVAPSGRRIYRTPRPLYSRLHGFNRRSNYDRDNAHALLNERGEVDGPYRDGGSP